MKDLIEIEQSVSDAEIIKMAKKYHYENGMGYASDYANVMKEMRNKLLLELQEAYSALKQVKIIILECKEQIEHLEDFRQGLGYEKYVTSERTLAQIEKFLTK